MIQKKYDIRYQKIPDKNATLNSDTHDKFI